jgi:hypothetical protein
VLLAVVGYQTPPFHYCICTPTPLQAFQRNVEYQLAGQTTGGILRLVLANTTYVSHPTFASVGADKAPGSSNSSSDKQTSKQYR